MTTWCMISENACTYARWHTRKTRPNLISQGTWKKTQLSLWILVVLLRPIYNRFSESFAEARIILILRSMKLYQIISFLLQQINRKNVYIVIYFCTTGKIRFCITKYRKWKNIIQVWGWSGWYLWWHIDLTIAMRTETKNALLRNNISQPLTMQLFSFMPWLLQEKWEHNYNYNALLQIISGVHLSEHWACGNLSALCE